jgi:AcrR family transcriptional regulator
VTSQPLASDPSGETKQRLLRAAETLFAREGIHRVRVREIHELAGQRNASALHYHFSSREGLVDAILTEHQASIDEEIARRLDELEASGEQMSVRNVVRAVVEVLGTRLETQSGRNFLRILPQIWDRLSAGIREGGAIATTRLTRRVLTLLDGLMEPLPRGVRRERLVSYVVMMTAAFAERAHHVESGRASELDTDAFVANVLDMIVASLTATRSAES